MRLWILCLSMTALLSAIATEMMPASAQSLRYKEKLHYVGMSCARIKKDTIAYPASEVFLHVTLVSGETGQAIGIPLPSKNRPYTKVTSGFKTKAGGRPLWQGEPQDVMMQVVMFEHDDGAPTAELASDILLNLALAVYGPNAPSDGEVTKVRDVAHGGQFLRGLNRALGIDNDPLGSVRVNLRSSEWSRAPLKQANGFRYHFATRHRKNGADCRAYFRFTQGDSYQVARQERQARQTPERGEYTQPEPSYSPQQLPPVEDPYLDPRFAEPAPLPPPPPIEPPREYNYGYRVGITNMCREPISVAYAYLDEDDVWTKRGWRTIRPGKTEMLDHYVGANELAVHSTIGALYPKEWTGRRDKINVTNDRFEAPMNAALSGDGLREVPFQIAEWRANDLKPVVRIWQCGSYRWGVWTKPDQIRTIAKQPKPILLQVNPSPEPEPAQPRVIAVEEPPVFAREPMQPAACQEIDRTAMSPAEIDRYKTIAARGMIKLCEAD